jgi:hypothetical protein
MKEIKKDDLNELNDKLIELVEKYSHLFKRVYLTFVGDVETEDSYKEKRANIRINTGFSGVEILGLYEVKKKDILKQMDEEDEHKPTVIVSKKQLRR